MRTHQIVLSEDGQITLTAYLQDYTPQMPFWKSRPAVLVLPGGGYNMLSEREADPVAFCFLAAGFHALILRYSIRDRATFPQPLLDLARAMRLIRSQAADWHLDPAKIAVCGFSAGGHLATTLGTLWNHPLLEEKLAGPVTDFQPNALVLGYPVISAIHYGRFSLFGAMAGTRDPQGVLDLLSCERHVGPHTPPAFIFHSYADGLVAVENSLVLAQAMAQANRPFELHIFTQGSHGLALADERTSNGFQATIEPRVEAWFDLAVSWLNRLFGTPVTSEVGPKPPPAERASWAQSQPAMRPAPADATQTASTAGEVAGTMVRNPTDTGGTSGVTGPSPQAGGRRGSLHITSPVVELCTDQAALAILRQHLSDAVDSEIIRISGPMSLRDLANYTGGQITEQQLAAIEAGLTSLPGQS